MYYFDSFRLLGLDEILDSLVKHGSKREIDGLKNNCIV